MNDNGYLMVAQANVGDLNSAFKTEIHQYLDRQGNPYYAPGVRAPGSKQLADPGGARRAQWHGPPVPCGQIQR